MQSTPFWEQTYADSTVSTFSQGPTADVKEFCHIFPPNSAILDVGCGEGSNAIFLAGLGHTVDAFDISAAGIEKAREIARLSGVKVNFFRCDLGEYVFEKEYDAILSHGVLHLPERPVRDRFIGKMQEATRPGGYNVIGIFTDRLPATPDNAPFTHSLFALGELPDKYRGWELVHHQESTFTDTHPGGIRHEHAYERIIARRGMKAFDRDCLRDYNHFIR